MSPVIVCLIGASITFGVNNSGTESLYYGQVLRQWFEENIGGYELRIRATPGIRWNQWLPGAGEQFLMHVHGEIQPDDIIEGVGFAFPLSNITSLEPYTDYFLEVSPCDVVWMMGGLNSATLGIATVHDPIDPDVWKDTVIQVAEAFHDGGADQVIIPFDSYMVKRSPGTGFTDQMVDDVRAVMVQYLDRWNTDIRDYASSRDWLHMGPDLYTLFGAYEHLYYGQDQLHPNTKGHKRIAREAMISLSPILRGLGHPWLSHAARKHKALY